MKRLLGACLAALTLAAPAQALSLRQALVAAYENSDLLEQNRYLLRLQDEGVAQQLAALRPIVSFTASTSYNGPQDVIVSSLNLTAEMVVFDNGGNALLVQSARAQVEAARQGLLALEQQVLLDAVQAYANVWRDAQVVQVRQANVRVVSEQLRAAQDRFDVGEATRTDVAQAEAQLAAARSNLAAARGQLEISEELYIIAIGVPVAAIHHPGTVPNIPNTESEADAMARATNPQVQQLRATVEANELALAAARSDYGPTVSLRAQTGTTEGGLNDGPSTSLTLSLTQPIYRGGQLFSLERVALATLAASEAQLNQQVRSIIQGVGNAYATLRIANAQITASREQIRAAQLALDGVSEEASLGARTTLDVLDAEQDLLDARIARIDSHVDLYLAAYSTLASMGLLTVEYLDLPVAAYDPNAYSDAFSNGPARINSEQGARLDALFERIGR